MKQKHSNEFEGLRASLFGSLRFNKDKEENLSQTSNSLLLIEGPRPIDLKKAYQTNHNRHLSQLHEEDDATPMSLIKGNNVRNK